MSDQLIRSFASEHEGTRLDRALTQLFPEYSRSFLAKLIDDGHVTVDGKKATKASFRVSAGQRVDVQVPPATPWPVLPQELPLTILYNDDDVVVIDKPAGLVVHPAAGHTDRTLVNALLFYVDGLSGIGQD